MIPRLTECVFRLTTVPLAVDWNCDVVGLSLHMVSRAQSEQDGQVSRPERHKRQLAFKAIK